MHFARSVCQLERTRQRFARFTQHVDQSRIEHALRGLRILGQRHFKRQRARHPPRQAQESAGGRDKSARDFGQTKPAVVRSDDEIAPESELVFCGISFGFADTAHSINGFQTERAEVQEFARFLA